jgi:glycosyltransferase 2 family protein
LPHAAVLYARGQNISLVESSRVHNGTMGRGAAKLAIKFAITIVLLWAAFRTVDVAAVSTLLLGLDLWWVAAALLLTGVLIVSDAMLLRAVMRIFGRGVPRGTAFLYSLVGWFFSNVAPSTVGGDIFRGVQLSRVGTPLGAAVRVILSIRLLSLATLVVVMIAGFPVALGLVGEHRDILVLAGTLSVAIAALTAVLLLARFRWRTSLLTRWALFEKLRRVSDGFRALTVPSANMARAWLAALTQHLLRVGVLASLATALGLGIPLATLFALAPAALLVAMVPMSIGGWGVRELTFVYFLGTAAISAEAALSLSVAFGLLRIFVGAIGGAVWVLLDEDHFRVDAPAG